MSGSWSSYADCVRGCASEMDHTEALCTWLRSYQVQDEHDAIKIALNLSVQVNWPAIFYTTNALFINVSLVVDEFVLFLFRRYEYFSRSGQKYYDPGGGGHSIYPWVGRCGRPLKP